MNQLLIIYWSASGNTEMMAKAIAEGATSASANVETKEVSAATVADIDTFDHIAFGCPSMGAEELESDEFEPFFESIKNKLNGKKVALFGSYGWGDGEWMRIWQSQVENLGADLFNNEGLIINETPNDDNLLECKNFGSSFAKY